MSFLIRYNDGFFNQGPEGSPRNGFPVTLEEASRYPTREAAQAKAADLANDDGTPVDIVAEEELPGALPVSAEQVLRWLHTHLGWDGHGYWLPELCVRERQLGQAPDAEVPRPTFEEFAAEFSDRVLKGHGPRGPADLES